jgi:hypothetical protein
MTPISRTARLLGPGRNGTLRLALPLSEQVHKKWGLRSRAHARYLHDGNARYGANIMQPI